MNEQSYANHRRLDPVYHYVISLLTGFFLIGSSIYLITTLVNENESNTELVAILLFATSINGFFIFWRLRTYPLLVQDRVIRTEENLRHYAMTGKLLDARLTKRQIIALRFASDSEFVELSRKAAEQGLTSNEIKKNIQIWRTDTFRI